MVARSWVNMIPIILCSSKKMIFRLILMVLQEWYLDQMAIYMASCLIQQALTEELYTKLT